MNIQSVEYTYRDGERVANTFKVTTPDRIIFVGLNEDTHLSNALDEWLLENGNEIQEPQE